MKIYIKTIKYDLSYNNEKDEFTMNCYKKSGVLIWINFTKVTHFMGPLK